MALRLKRVAKWIGLTLLAVAMLPSSYLVVAYGLTLFPVNKTKSHQASVLQAYVVSNGVHTDFVFPVKSQWIDWRTIFPWQDFSNPNFLQATQVDVVMIGWGDERFYLNTPQWEDLTLSTALSALAGMNPSLIHVTYYWEKSLPQASYKLPLDAEQYEALIQYIKATLQRKGDAATLVPDAGYAVYDRFYRAQGSFSVFNTCNTWVGEGLQRAGVPVSIWTPLADNVFKQLEKRE